MDIMLDRFKGVFTNKHTSEKKKIKKVEWNEQAEGNYVIEFEDKSRWNMKLFCKHWYGEFKSST